MARIVRTLPARSDLREIWTYVAKNKEAPADRLIDKFDRALRMIARYPHTGQAMDEYRPGLRRFTVGNYVLFFAPIEGGIRLIRVLHGARRIEDLFSADDPTDMEDSQ